MIHFLLKKILIWSCLSYNYMVCCLFKQIFKTNLQLEGKLNFYQKVIPYGVGTITLKNNVLLGVPFGGGFFNGCIELQSRYKNSHLVIGENTAINNNAFIACANSIVISDNCLIGRNLSMSDFEAHNTNPLLRNNLGMIGNIYIGKNVWIGNNVTILKNVTIGCNSIIASGSVVLKGFYPDNVIIGGNPARIIKEIDIKS